MDSNLPRRLKKGDDRRRLLTTVCGRRFLISCRQLSGGDACDRAGDFCPLAAKASRSARLAYQACPASRVDADAERAEASRCQATRSSEP